MNARAIFVRFELSYNIKYGNRLKQTAADCRMNLTNTKAWSNSRIFLILLFCALIVRTIYLLSSPNIPQYRYFNFDEADYELIAKNLFEGNGYCYLRGHPTAFRPPLYPLVVASVYKASGTRNHAAVRWVQVLLSSATAGLVFLLGLLVFGRGAGVWAGAIFALYPTMLYYVPKLMTETLFIALLYASLVTVVLAIKRGAANLFAAAGLLFGVSFLCRPVLLPFIIGLFVPMMFLLSRRKVIHRTAVCSIAFLAVFVAAVSPWVIRNYIVFDEFIPTDTHLGWVLWHNTKVHFDFDADFAKSKREIDQAQAKGKLTSEGFFDAIQRHAHFGVQAQQNGISKAYGPAQVPRTETQISRFFVSKAVEFYGQHKFRFVRDRVANFINFWMPISSIEGRKGKYLYCYGVIALFAAIGLYLAIKKQKLIASLPLLLIVANFWIATTLIIYHSRLKMPADIVTIVFAGYSMDAIRREKGLKWLLCIAAIAIGLNLIAGLFLLSLKELVKAVL